MIFVLFEINVIVFVLYYLYVLYYIAHSQLLTLKPILSIQTETDQTVLSFYSIPRNQYFNDLVKHNIALFSFLKQIADLFYICTFIVVFMFILYCNTICFIQSKSIDLLRKKGSLIRQI